MVPSMIMVPEVIPAGMLTAALETGLVAIALLVLAGVLGLCFELSIRRRAGRPALPSAGTRVVRMPEASARRVAA